MKNFEKNAADEPVLQEGVGQPDGLRRDRPSRSGRRRRRPTRTSARPTPRNWRRRSRRQRDPRLPRARTSPAAHCQPRPRATRAARAPCRRKSRARAARTDARRHAGRWPTHAELDRRDDRRPPRRRRRRPARRHAAVDAPHDHRRSTPSTCGSAALVSWLSLPLMFAMVYEVDRALCVHRADRLGLRHEPHALRRDVRARRRLRALQGRAHPLRLPLPQVVGARRRAAWTPCSTSSSTSRPCSSSCGSPSEWAWTAVDARRARHGHRVDAAARARAGLPAVRHRLPASSRASRSC